MTAVITGERGDETPDPPRPGGVRRRLRDLPRPPRHRADLHAPAAGRQVPRLGPRHERVPLPDRRATASASCRSPPLGLEHIGHPGANLHAASRGSMRCWAARGTIGAAPSSSRARRARARRASPPRSPMPPAARGERCLYFAFEESPSQIIRNMRSIGIDLEPWVDRRVCSGSTRRARRSTASRCTSPTDARGHRGLQAQRRHRRPDHELRLRGRADESQGDADAAHRLPEGRAASRPCSPP